MDNEFDHDAIYINIAVNTGINSTQRENLANQPSTIIFKNQNSIIDDPSQYYISLQRATLTTSAIPMYIFPIKNGLTQTNINLSPFTVKFEYWSTALLRLYFYSDNVIYQSQILDSQPYPPSQNNGYQDFTNSQFYYYVYDVSWMLNIFNSSIKKIFSDFCSGLLTATGITISPDLFPFYTYNNTTRLFTLNFPKSIFDQSIYPQVLMYQDGLSGDLFNCPANVYADELENNYLMKAYDLYDNTIIFDSTNYYAMSASETQFNIWCPVRRIVFTIDNVPIRKLEIDSSFDNVPFTAQNNNDPNSIIRPNLPIFFDLSVDPDEFGRNRNILQYAVSSIAQSRLVALGSGQPVKNFVINIWWVDIYGNQRPLLGVANSNNVLKICFFKKSTCLL